MDNGDVSRFAPRGTPFNQARPAMWPSNLFWLLIGPFTCLLVLALGLSAWLSRRVYQPLRALKSAANQVADGAYGQRVFVDARGEVGALSQAFNNMSQRLADKFSQIDEDRQQLRTVLSSMLEGVVAIDPQQRVLFANDRAGQLLEFSPRASVGRHLWEIVRHPRLYEMVQSALEQNREQSQELHWAGPMQRSYFVHVARLPGSAERGAVLVLHDNTELRRLERLRQEFVANVSHELKTPLAIIKACVETLLDAGFEDSTIRKNFLERIADQSDRLHRLILDLLRLARIESETEAFTREDLPVERLVLDCIDRHRTLAQARNQTLSVHPPEVGQEAVVWADEEALQQILDNLVDNALKYTPEGGAVSVRWGKHGEQVVIQVQDTGIGIPESELARIFERFYRVDKARSRELGGTGLGLSIVKHLAQAMQGSIQAASQVGKGTTFTVLLPAYAGEDGPRA